MNRPALALSLIVLALAACVDHTLTVSDYDKKCTMDSECVDVFIGDACSTCRCSNDSINMSALPQYQRDLDDAASCRLGSPTCNVQCMFKPPVCQGGTCVLPK